MTTIKETIIKNRNLAKASLEGYLKDIHGEILGRIQKELEALPINSKTKKFEIQACFVQIQEGGKIEATFRFYRDGSYCGERVLSLPNKGYSLYCEERNLLITKVPITAELYLKNSAGEKITIEEFLGEFLDLEIQVDEETE